MVNNNKLKKRDIKSGTLLLCWYNQYQSSWSWKNFTGLK